MYIEISVAIYAMLFPGSVIRCMRRLEEALRQMCQAAKAIGNIELENKFAEGRSSTVSENCITVDITYG